MCHDGRLRARFPETVRSRIFIGEVYHQRSHPVTHRFRYPAYSYAFDLAEMDQLDQCLLLFGYNRWRPIAVFDRDFLGPAAGSIAAKLMAAVRERGWDGQVRRVMLVTSTRFFGYSFNPASFYYCYGPCDRLLGVVAEVTDAFGRPRVYVLDQPAEPVAAFQAHYRLPRADHPPPLDVVEGDYDFRFADPDDRLDIQIRVLRDNQVVFLSWLRGHSLPLCDSNLAGALIRFPFNALLTVPRIYLERARLRFLKKLPRHSRWGPFHL